MITSVNKMKLISSILLIAMLSVFEAHAQTPSGKSIPQNWPYLDPVEDSIVGISLEKAYMLLKGRTFKNVIVAVIDNGVDINHQDLQKIIWTNVKEVATNGIDDDKNGFVDDVHGWNFRGAGDGTVIENEQSSSTQLYLAWKGKSNKKHHAMYARAAKEYLEKSNSTDSIDRAFVYNVNYNSSLLIANDNGIHGRHYGSPVMKLSSNLSHGTHVAGIVKSVADHALIMPLLATTATGDERDKDVANAIYYAVDNGAQIINMSFSKLFSPEKNLVDEAIKYAERKNVLIIHAAGNDGVNIDSAVNYHYPIAIYEDGKRAKNFISVGWSRALFDNRLAHPRSDYGKENVDVFAPGSDIFSTIPGNEYGSKSGSSMSAPIVSGVAALLLSYFPSLPATQLKEIILKSSFKPDQVVNKPLTQIKVPFNSLSVSGGIVNAFGAVELAIDQYDRK
jgi:subtilisin family serine protease